MKDVSFYMRQGKWILMVRKSCQVALAEPYFRQYGYDISFRYIPYWYEAQLPKDLPQPLIDRLKKRAQRLSPKTTATEF